MKVIKESKLCCTCAKCFSVLEYTKSDITYGLKNHVAYIICPICDNVMEEAKIRNISKLKEKEQIEKIPEEDLDYLFYKKQEYAESGNVKEEIKCNQSIAKTILGGMLEALNKKQ